MRGLFVSVSPSRRLTDAEPQRRSKDQPLRAHLPEQADGEHAGTEQELFRNGSLCKSVTVGIVTYDNVGALLVQAVLEPARVSHAWEALVEVSGVERADEEQRSKRVGNRCLESSGRESEQLRCCEQLPSQQSLRESSLPPSSTGTCTASQQSSTRPDQQAE